MKLLDDIETKKEANASLFGLQYQSTVFKQGDFAVDDEARMTIPYTELRWQNFRHKESSKMYEIVSNYVFPFIKTVNGDGKETAFSTY